MWKSHTGIVADEIYNNLGDTDLLLDNQKGCYRNSIGTKNLWLIDKVVVKNFTRRMVGLSMVWIDYQKVYVWYTIHGLGNPWKCVDSWKTSYLLFKSMESWKTIFTSGNEKLARVNIPNLTGIYSISLFVCDWSNLLKPYTTKSKRRIPIWKWPAEKDKSSSLHGSLENL